MDTSKNFRHPGNGKKPDARTDAELVALFRTGDTRSLELLFSRHRSRLRQLACRTLRSNVFADDVLQQAYIKAWKELGSVHYTEKEHFGTWLGTIVYHECISLLRREKHMSHSGEIPEPPPPGIIEEKLTDELYGQLTEAEQQVVYLHDEQGLEYEEAGRQLHISTSGARRNHERAVQHIKQLLKARKKKF